MDLKTTSIATDNTLIRILVNIENLEGETIMGMARIYEEDIDFKMLFNSLNIFASLPRILHTIGIEVIPYTSDDCSW